MRSRLIASSVVLTIGAALRPLGLTVHTIPDGNLRIITVANVEHFGLEESRPLPLPMNRVKEAGVTVEWASLPGP